MSRVRQRGTDAETRVGAVLRSLGAHYRLNAKSLPGSPDFSNRRRRWALFVHGCFWHHHTGCPRATIPKSNTVFWQNKFRDNRRRDARVVKKLRCDGLLVIVVWECEALDADMLKIRLSNMLKSRGIDMRQPKNH